MRNKRLQEFFTGVASCYRVNIILFISSMAVANPAGASLAHRDVANIVFIGDSITKGVNLPRSPPEFTVDWLQQHDPGLQVFFANQGVSGHTTLNALPLAHSDFPAIEAAAMQLQGAHAGRLVFSVMLGTNDSAMEGPLGSPVSPENYGSNLATIIDRLLEDYPASTVILHRPLWYSANTYNGARYLAEGQERLRSYFPEIDALVTRYERSHPRQVLRGDTRGYEVFKRSYRALLAPEDGKQGTFYLHPNSAGARQLGLFWGSAIEAALHQTAE